LTAVDTHVARAALERDRATSLVQLDHLRRDLADVIAAAADVATDDEHDPEGATIAYERSRMQALLEQTETHLVEIGLALERLDAGTYGICVECGREIGAERLQARPASRTCITCVAR
jgi:RNA polymerase-binding transcription factor DksA